MSQNYPDNYTTWTALCGCRITYRWSNDDDPAHRKHVPVDDDELAAARLEHSGRDFPDHIRRVGCPDHWNDDVDAHHRAAFLAHYAPHPDHRLEWHEGGGFTVHHEPAEG